LVSLKFIFFFFCSNLGHVNDHHPYVVDGGYYGSGGGGGGRGRQQRESWNVRHSGGDDGWH
jgi:hypothetical protein